MVSKLWWTQETIRRQGQLWSASGHLCCTHHRLGTFCRGNGRSLDCFPLGQLEILHNAGVTVGYNHRLRRAGHKAFSIDGYDVVPSSKEAPEFASFGCGDVMGKTLDIYYRLVNWVAFLVGDQPCNTHVCRLHVLQHRLLVVFPLKCQAGPGRVLATAELHGDLKGVASHYRTTMQVRRENKRIG